MDISTMHTNRGDCIWVRWEDQCPHNIIIDSGPAATKAMFRRLIQNEIILKGESVDLLVLTHIDDDHTRGFLYYLADYSSDVNADTFREVWFNTGIRCLSSTHSPNSAAILSCKLNSLGIHYSDSILKGHTYSLGDVELKVICPNIASVNAVNHMIIKQHPSLHSAPYVEPLSDIIASDRFIEDTSETNKASISMILTYRKNFRIAFLGDSHDEDIREGFAELSQGQAMDIVKLSHHGSSHNLSNGLIDMLKTKRYILLSNRDMDMATLARIYQKANNANESAVIYCNYPQPLANRQLLEAGNSLLKLEKLDSTPILLCEEEGTICKIQLIQ